MWLSKKQTRIIDITGVAVPTVQRRIYLTTVLCGYIREIRCRARCCSLGTRVRQALRVLEKIKAMYSIDPTGLNAVPSPHLRSHTAFFTSKVRGAGRA